MEKQQKFGVLVVDDQEIQRDLMASMLEQMKRYLPEDKVVEVFFARDGFEALEILVVKQAHLVLTDYEMPGMNGAELTEKIKFSYPQTIVVISSGHPNVPRASADFFRQKCRIKCLIWQILILLGEFRSLKSFKVMEGCQS